MIFDGGNMNCIRVWFYFIFKKILCSLTSNYFDHLLLSLPC